MKNDNNKFKTADELLKAYNALEREFTKRCQLLKQLQAERSAEPAESEPETEQAQADTAAEPTADVLADVPSADVPGGEKPDGLQSCTDPQSDITAAVTAVAVAVEPKYAELVAAGAETAPAPTTDEIWTTVAENAAEYAEMLAAIPEIMDACIARYKKQLIGVNACAAPRGMAVIMPTAHPKTLMDAKRLADEMLK